MSKPTKMNTLVSLKDEVKKKLSEDNIMLKLKPGDRIAETEVKKNLVSVRCLYRKHLGPGGRRAHSFNQV
ncbi:hypothetical protein [Rossellomorea sp. DA94]|uniref:hypothetical protein n=1 Tax=Rossellomorea sp. DA94 TaxID=3038653 RepID=UPI00244A761F|nr:hypothetical protein [Rossellomorea sp. DA94]WGG45374.1 hypothetical protein P8596_22150 [Rossellomorea sp. DA94]